MMEEIIEKVEMSNLPLEEAEGRILDVIEQFNGQYFPSEVTEKASLTQQLGLEVVIPSLLRKHKIKFNDHEKLILIPNGGNGSAKGDDNTRHNDNM